MSYLSQCSPIVSPLNLYLKTYSHSSPTLTISHVQRVKVSYVFGRESDLRCLIKWVVAKYLRSAVYPIYTVQLGAEWNLMAHRNMQCSL